LAASVELKIEQPVGYVWVTSAAGVVRLVDTDFDEAIRAVVPFKKVAARQLF
jgi:hypothetical protein